MRQLYQRKGLLQILQMIDRFLYDENATDTTPPYLFKIQNQIKLNILNLERKIKDNKQIIQKLQETIKFVKNHEKYKVTEESIRETIRELNTYEGSWLYEIAVFRFIADTFVWIFYTPYTIRQFCKKDPPGGFLTDKKGFIQEVEISEAYSRTNKFFVLIHELTNCLRSGDLTFINEETGEHLPIELKYIPADKTMEDFKRIVRRAEKQLDNYDLMTDFLRKGEVSGETLLKLFPEYKKHQKLRDINLRKSYTPPEKLTAISKEHYGPEIEEELIKALKERKSSFVTFDNIIGYKIYYDSLPLGNNQRAKLNKFLKSHCSLIEMNLRERVVEYPEIKPFIFYLSPKIATQLLLGKLYLTVIVNDYNLAQYLRKNGINAEIDFRKHKHFVYHDIEIQAPDPFHVSVHYPLNYLLFAFHTPEYLLAWTKDNIKSMPEEIEKIKKEYGTTKSERLNTGM